MANALGGYANEMNVVFDTSGNLFPLDSCKRDYTYDANDSISTITATLVHTSEQWRMTWTYTATYKVLSITGWVKQ